MKLFLMASSGAVSAVADEGVESACTVVGDPLIYMFNGRLNPVVHVHGRSRCITILSGTEHAAN